MPLKELFKNLFRKKVVKLEQSDFPDHCRLYCIGDIHGRLDLLQQVHQKIHIHATDFIGRKLVVYLGDYVDRGPHSKQVVDYLLTNPLPEFESIYLLGNHEQSLLQFLYSNHVALAHDWFRFGGIATLQSYGVALNGIPTAKDIDRLRCELSDKCPEEHKIFYQKLLISFELGHYFFVHAGVKPKVDLKNQNHEDLLWIRDEFINSKTDHGKIIVHGHTVTDKPDIKFNRIGLDTGAYITNNLTCAVFDKVGFDFI